MLQVYTPSDPIRWRWIDFEGPDAQDFLHRLTTANARGLLPGDGTEGCFLTPQGRIRAYFRLWNPAPAHYGFELDAGSSDHWKTALLSTIEQFTFAEKLKITDRPDLSCAWVFGLPADGQGPLRTETREDIFFCHQGSRAFGRPWSTLWGTESGLKRWLSTQDTQGIAFEKLEEWRISAMGARVDAEILDSTNPLEAGLKEAIAPNKGCYPGQEVIEKIVALGSPARRLALLEGTGPAPQPGEKLLSQGAEAGVLTSVAAFREESRFLALAYLKKTHAREGVELGFEKQASSQAKVAQITPYA